MIRMIILLPVENTIKHIRAICEASRIFGASYTTSEESESNEIPIENFRIWEKSDSNSSDTRNIQSIGKPEIGKISVLPARDNSILLLTAEEDSSSVFNKFVEELKHHFRLIGFLADSEPWRNSPPDKMERDRTIWETRNQGDTWERVAEKANCAVTTAKVSYQEMLMASKNDSG